MIIRLPFPAAELFPNKTKGKSWKGTAVLRKKQRADGFYCAKQAGTFVDKGGDIPISLLFIQPDGYHRDTDGMHSAAKNLLDGVADGLGINDRRFRPVLLDWVRGEAPGGIIMAIGVQITSGVNLE